MLSIVTGKIFEIYFYHITNWIWIKRIFHKTERVLPEGDNIKTRSRRHLLSDFIPDDDLSGISVESPAAAAE